MNGNFNRCCDSHLVLFGVQNAVAHGQGIALCMMNILNAAVFVGKFFGTFDARVITADD